MLILLPESEAKNTVARGAPLDADELSFPALTPTRRAVLDALVDVSAAPDATRRLGVPESLADVVRANVDLLDAPTAAAGSVYAGGLYDGLDVDGLDPAARRRARSWIVVISSLWGAVRLGDRIPPYRLNMCGRLPGVGHLPQVWQGPLEDVLPGAARRGLVVDGRSSDYATAWRPHGELAERTVVLKVLDHRGARPVASHTAKFTRGVIARRIVSDAIDPSRPEDLADALATHFDVDLHPPARPRRTWQLDVVATPS